MNIVRELRKKKGIQQKELAIAIGVSCPTVSAWETNKKDPSGERLKKLANYFNVDELFILGYGLENPNTFVPVNPKISGLSETEQIVQYVLDRLNVHSQIDETQMTEEAKIISSGINRMPEAERKRALNILSAAYSEYFDKTEDKIG